MTVDALAVSPAGEERTARIVVLRLTARRAIRSAVVWGYVFGVTVASAALSYTSIYKTAPERRQLARSFGANRAASALFGPAPKLQTVAGFTVFKVSMTLMVVGAVWGLLTSTRLLRGDEEAGRWELLTSGLTTKGGAAAQALGGLVAAASVLWVVTALVTVVVGRSSSVRIDAPAGLYFALALVASALMFLAVGALTSQLVPSRRTAAGYAAVVLGLSYGVRMVGDSGSGLHCLVWASPLGWVEALRPLTDPRPWALAPIGGFTAALVLAAVVLASRRDVGAGTWSGRNSRAPRLRLLSGPGALALRLSGPSVLWWAVASAVSGLLVGIVAQAAGTTIVGSSVHKVFARLGAPGTGTRAFLGVTFVILAVAVAFEAASQLSAAREEEADGRLDHLLANTVGRRWWLAGRLSVGAAGLLVSALAAAGCAWLGAASQGAGVGAGSVLAAGLNMVAPAFFLLGVGALALGLWPAGAVAVVYVVLGWSALIELVGGFFAQNHWVLDTSVFHQMAAAPAVGPDWRTDGVLGALGLVSMALGAAGIGRRDLRAG